MRTFRQLMYSIALLAFLGTCAASLPTDDSVDVETSINDPIRRTVEVSSDGNGIAIAHVDQNQIYPEYIDSVATFTVIPENVPILQIIYLQSGQALRYTRYLGIKNIIYRDMYTEFRDRWDQEEYNTHKMRTLSRMVNITDLNEIHRRTMWSYFNTWLAMHQEFGISYETFELNILRKVEYEDDPPSKLIVRYNAKEKDLWINLGAVSGLFILGTICGLISSWVLKKLKNRPSL